MEASKRLHTTLTFRCEYGNKWWAPTESNFLLLLFRQAYAPAIPETQIKNGRWGRNRTHNVHRTGNWSTVNCHTTNSSLSPNEKLEFIVGFEPTARISDHVSDGGSLRCSPHQTKHCMNSEEKWYHRWESNPHYTDFESVDSANWSTVAPIG